MGLFMPAIFGIMALGVIGLFIFYVFCSFRWIFLEDLLCFYLMENKIMLSGVVGG